MYKKSGIQTFQQHFKAGGPKRWLVVPKERMAIHIEGPFDVGDVKHHETATSVSPGTEAGHNPAARRPAVPRPSTQEPASEQHPDANHTRLSHETAQLNGVSDRNRGNS